MVTCPGCNAIVFIDMDGMAHVASLEQEALGKELTARAPSPIEDAPPAIDSLLNYQNPPEPMDVDRVDSDRFDTHQIGTDQVDTADPLGLSAYANSEMSGAMDGAFVVTVIISGIDAKDLRDDIRQVLQDPRFGWNVSALMAGIRNGELRLERITPVKATIVVNRIKHLSVSIRWEQNAITDLDSDERPTV